jgi:phospholipid transport system substrate-binding protein
MNIYKNYKKYFVVLAAVLLSCSFVSHNSARASVPDPTAQLKPFLDKIVAELKNHDYKTDTSCKKCNRIVEIAKEHFDFYEMSKRVLGRSWRKLTQEEKDQFVTLFTKLLQYAYIGKVDDYVESTIEYKKQRIKGNRAEVQTVMVSGNTTIAVFYIMILKKDTWMVYDIVAEGVSLVRNYMEQFRSILHDEKFSGLIAQLQKKIKELEAEQNKESGVTPEAG